LDIDSSATIGDRSVTVVTAGGVSGAKTFRVQGGPTQVTLTSSANPSNFGNPVTFTATLTSSSNGSFSGTVQFKEGNTTIGTGGVSNGQAQFTSATLGAGPHSISAVYSGDATFEGSTSPVLTQTVNRGGVTILLTSGSNPASYGQSISLT